MCVPLPSPHIGRQLKLSPLGIRVLKNFSRLRDRLNSDGGFTLLETLAVMVIVGLLAAITIPQISKWREKAYVTSMKADARSMGAAIEAYYVDKQEYPTASQVYTDYSGSNSLLAVEMSNGNGVGDFRLFDENGDIATDQNRVVNFAFTVSSNKGNIYNGIYFLWYDTRFGGIR